MKTIGLIGGLSWESTTDYYKYINTLVKERMGGLHSAKCLLYSFDFEEMVQLQHNGEWEKATNHMIEAAMTHQDGGADLILICTNTMHKMAEEIESVIEVPLLHIADTTAVKIKDRGIKKVGLLGTEFTMEQDFYKNRLKKHEVEIVIPTEEERERVHSIIYQELCKGEINCSSKEEYLSIINKLHQQGAEGIILGCTEIPLLVSQKDTTIPLFDTTYIHAEAAVTFALEQERSALINS